MVDQVQGRNDLSEKKSSRNTPRKGKKHSYTDTKERKKSRLDKAFNYQKKKED